MQHKDHIAELLKRYLHDKATEKETLELMAWVEKYPEDKDWALLLQAIGLEQEADPAYEPERWNAMITDILSKGQPETAAPAPVHRVHFLRTAWFRYAAAIIITLGVATYLYIHQQNNKPDVATTSPVPMQNDVLPGGDKAILTLADGSTIILDSAANGTIAQQTGATVTKRADGELVYESTADRGSTAPEMNTMSTPRGGQYQLTLPDGSQVWLNAESSITYPTAFDGNERKVSVTGEAYFEVAHDKTKKFIVSVEGKQDVEVLGTHFNVNAYNDEVTIKTTLLEGAIRLSSKSVHTSIILKPGQQGQLQDQKLSLAVSPDIEQVMAWKNGVFNFNNADLQTVMRQLERWYDVDVLYEGAVPKKTFGGRMGRDLNLSQVIKILGGLGVKFRIEGKKLFVTP